MSPINSNEKEEYTQDEMVYTTYNDTKTDESKRISLLRLSQKEIVEIFTSISQDNRQIVIPIGFPEAGKSWFISSLMFYSAKNTAKRWSAQNMVEYPFEMGNISRDGMIKNFEENKGKPQTSPGTLDLIGMNVIPQKKSRPLLNLAFVDLAGEDLKSIRTDDGGKFSIKIEGILKACEFGKPIFCLITPYKPRLGDTKEDAMHDDFLNYLKVTMPRLYEASRFIVIVTQWDKMIDQMSIENYIEKYRPRIHNAMKARNAKIVYGEFSVGDVMSVLDEHNQKVDFLSKVNFKYPHNFWNNLYKLATGKSLEGDWWEKLLGL